MKYLAIDIETTGLDTQRDQVLEVGCIIDTLPKNGGTLSPVHSLPRFRVLIRHDNVSGHPTALAMNHKILSAIASQNKCVNCQTVIPEVEFDKRLFYGFTEERIFCPKCSTGQNVPIRLKQSYVSTLLCRFLKGYFKETKITIAGKNVAGFDVPFLSHLSCFGLDGSQLMIGSHDDDMENYTFRSRVLDPGSLFFWPDFDDVLPNIDEIMRRCGIERKTDHTSLGDCEMVIEAIRAYYTQPRPSMESY